MKSLLGVPASSATSERVFSPSDRVLEKRRQSLNPDIVDDILIIRNFRNIWYQFCLLVDGNSLNKTLYKEDDIKVGKMISRV